MSSQQNLSTCTTCKTYFSTRIMSTVLDMSVSSATQAINFEMIDLVVVFDRYFFPLDIPKKFTHLT